MARLPSLSAKKVIRALKVHGFVLDHATGSHYVFLNIQMGRRVTVPYHTKDLPKGTLVSILRQAGLSRKDL